MLALVASLGICMGSVEARASRTLNKEPDSHGKRAMADRAGASAKCTADYRNCHTFRRCCNSASKCYTKAAGVPFAQCRPKGCLGTCGWECRILHPAKQTVSGGPEYGEGAQNLTQAVAAMQQPPARPADGSAPAGRSDRLGNVIDSWYFAGLGSGVALAHLMSTTCTMATCFAKYLATQSTVTANDAQREAALRETTLHSSWGLYSYATIRHVMPQIRHDLRGAMRRNAAAYDPSLARQRYDGGDSHLVIHYRLGDFVTNSWCIAPADVAAAAAALSPTVVEIMDGGMRHLDQVDGYSAGPHRANRTRQQYALRLSSELQGELEGALRAALPSARITRTPPASIDADWFRIVHAPMLVSGAGSFAVTAAIASHGREVRTPASDNLNFPDRGVRPVETLAANWRTYSYSASAMRG